MKKTITVKKPVRLVAIALALSAVAGTGLMHIFNQKVDRTLTESAEAYGYTEAAEPVTRDTLVPERDRDVRSYLFLGVDDAGLNYEEYGRGGRTDTMLLLVKNGTDIRVLEISRDTMTEVDAYDTAGDYLSTGVMQINMQYSFGDSPRRSAYLTKRTVSKLLGGVDIDGTAALNMSGIAPVVDALGGIDVVMEEDCTRIDPAYVRGAEIHMDGKAAERFVRWRDPAVSAGSNDGRMDRHSWFIRQMLEKADSDRISKLLDAAEPYLNTDLTAEELKTLSECRLTGMIRLPGEDRAGARHEEFYVDEDKLQDLIIELFYTTAAAG